MEKLYHLSQRPLPVLPLAHFFCGGIVTDENGETSLPGFYAAGEVAAGIHGANRLGGNALSEAAVFGARAGQAAATFVAGHGIPEVPAGLFLLRDAQFAPINLAVVLPGLGSAAASPGQCRAQGQARIDNGMVYLRVLYFLPEASGV